ncbi:MAG: PQQ-like beta-propeller repeat protein [Verrucomicrobia bacterium]|nr:PQQ-like beta-propeller repeat protein [Verrucomicrobiota bacterium]
MAIGLGVLSASVQAGDWPQWRGADRDAKVAGFTAPKTWPKELTQKWKITVGEGVSTPALVGDKLYVFSRQEGNEVTRCLEAATGKEVWQDKYESLGASGPAQQFSGPRSSPAVGNGKVVTLGVRGMLSCLDAATGKKLWRKDDFAGAYPRFHPASSPMIMDGLCVVQVGGQGNGGCVAYDLATGDQKWKWTEDGPGYASPVLMTVGGAKLVVAMTDRKIVALGAADGKLVWETPFTVQGMGYNAATPIVDGQTMFYTGSGRGVKAVQIEKTGDTFAAKELWSNPDKSVQFNTPVLKDGFLYGLTQGNEFFCLNAKTGQAAWTAPVGPAPAAGQGGMGGGGMGGGRGGRGGGRGGYGSIVDAGSVLLALTPASELIVFQPNDKAYTEQARIKVAEGQTHAYPILSGNRLFIKDTESLTLFAIE